MRYSADEISLASELKTLGLPWEPEAGQFVFDKNKICPQSSPFQPGVYFLLNFDCFMQRVGGVERFVDNMVWLPTWHEARSILLNLGVSLERTVAQVMPALEDERELLCLYNLIYEALLGRLGSGEAGEAPWPR